MIIYSKSNSFNADLYTPLELFLRIRNVGRKPCLLECSDYRDSSESTSFIAFDPLVELVLIGSMLEIRSGDSVELLELNKQQCRKTQIQQQLDRFHFENPSSNGFFGRLSFEFNNVDETHLQMTSSDLELPELHLIVYEKIIRINHYTNEGEVIVNSLKNEVINYTIQDLVKNIPSEVLPFESIGEEFSQYRVDEFKQKVHQAKEACKRGDVFQLVISKRYTQTFFGDDFQVYRSLRRINPSPFLFYFDFEIYRCFGSSPEAQIRVNQGVAELNPIAGTVPKSGDPDIDLTQLDFLKMDEKENAEHTMLVDLARNDLSRDCEQVQVTKYKEIQHFSHVIHMVSKVKGKMMHNKHFETLCHSFPAGTLSGTPKPRALELIHTLESETRDFYGGCIGMIGADRSINMAIVIRSILSKNNCLHYQAGAGVVLDSNEQNEYLEVQHKLRPLRVAIQLANEVSNERLLPKGNKHGN